MVLDLDNTLVLWHALEVSTEVRDWVRTLHDAGRQDGIDFLVMELLEGETLAARLERGPLPTTLALQLAMQIVSALVMIGLLLLSGKGLV